MDSRQPKWAIYLRESSEFERYALSLLRAEANEQGKVLLTSNELSDDLAVADGVAPQGLFDLPGPVFVQIKVRYSERLITYLERVRSYPTEVGSFIFVFKEGRIPYDRITDSVRRDFPTFGLRILGKDELVHLAQKHPDAALPFNTHYFASAVNTFKARDEHKHLNNT